MEGPRSHFASPGSISLVILLLFLAYLASPPFAVWALSKGDFPVAERFLIIFYAPLEVVYDHVPPYHADFDATVSLLMRHRSS
jgi:hypothetical protein